MSIELHNASGLSSEFLVTEAEVDLGRRGRTALLGGMCGSAALPTLAHLIRMLRKEE